MRMANLRNLLVVCVFLSVIVPPAVGKIIYVNDDANGLNDGTSWADAYKHLQSALEVADGKLGDLIWVAEGIYTPGTNRTDSFAMKNGVTIYGGFPDILDADLTDRNPSAYDTILSGDIGTPVHKQGNCYHVFYHPSSMTLNSTSVLDGFTITGGYADGGGADSFGGGMYNSGSSPTVTNCVFLQNEAVREPGLGNGMGGGMYNKASSPTVTNCVFTQNKARRGGGVGNYVSSLTLTGCVFTQNETSEDGGGMYNESSSPTITNCVFSYNKANATGGGIFNLAVSKMTLANCTFYWNTALYYGGVMYCVTSANIVVTNCILWQDWPDEISSCEGLDVIYSDVQGGTGKSWFGTGCIDQKPKFAGPALGELHLLVDSPCIDTGDNAAVPPGVTTDLDGKARIVDGDDDSTATVDMKDVAILCGNWLAGTELEL